jgi:hypothetical protein
LSVPKQADLAVGYPKIPKDNQDMPISRCHPRLFSNISGLQRDTLRIYKTEKQTYPGLAKLIPDWPN